MPDPELELNRVALTAELEMKILNWVEGPVFISVFVPWTIARIFA
jgi:hypothetical protein